MIILLAVLLIISILLEGTITTLPLTLICLLCFTILKRDTTVFPVALLAGIFIDVFRVQTLGMTSVFYVCFLLLVLLYKKKYEIYSTPFVMLATLFGSFFFLYIFGLDHIFLQSAFSALLAGLLFSIIRIFDSFKAKRSEAQFKPI